MKLHSLGIENYRAVRNLDLSFETRPGRVRPVTVLAGPNGCGKTSVLFAIVQTLRYVMRYRTDDVPMPGDSDIHQSALPHGLSETPPEASVRLKLRLEPSELEAIPEAFRDTADPERPTASELKSIDGGVTAEWRYPPRMNADGTMQPPNFLHRCTPRDALPWLQGRARAIHGWNKGRLKDPGLIDHIGGLCLFPQDRNLHTRVVGEVGNGLATRALPAADDALDEDAVQRGAAISPVADILRYLGQYARQREDALPDDRNWEQRVKREFARICAPKEYVGYLFRPHDPHGAPYLRDGDAVYPLHMAASGEQVILEYVTRLTYPSPLNNSIILIDEPEIHLHPVWLRRLYQALPQLGDNNQFILTTHSPELRTLAAQDGALVDMGELGGEDG